MNAIQRVVLDTSFLISAALKYGTVPRQALLKAFDNCEVYGSRETNEELERVLQRKKFEPYLDAESRIEFLKKFQNYSTWIEVPMNALVMKPSCETLKIKKIWRWPLQPMQKQSSAVTWMCLNSIRGTGY